ncbi:MAG: hypothetical protein M3A24_00350, partial [Candidatus Rhabdochlamydia oedothoracis]|nr:hypothetical protein [Candidatus Rhabdochlamydia oedothoracis]
EHSLFVDNLVNTSGGVSKLRAFLGLLFSKVSTLSISLEVVSKKLCVLGKYCLYSFAFKLRVLIYKHFYTKDNISLQDRAVFSKKPSYAILNLKSN